MTKFSRSLLLFLICLLSTACTSRFTDMAPIKDVVDAQQSPSLSNGPIVLQPSTIDDTETYRSEAGGYSFRYPRSYVVKESPHSTSKPGTVGILQTQESPSEDAVVIKYLDFEIETEELLTWAEIYESVVGVPYHELTFSTLDSRNETFSPGTQRIYVESTPASFYPLQGYYITHGNMVLSITKFTSDPKDNLELLQLVMETLDFASDAPTNLEDLYAPDQDPNGARSLREYLEEQAGGELVAEALTIYLQTGKPATELLERMTEAQRILYEMILQRDQDIFNELERQRTQPTPTEQYDLNDFEEYRQSEDDQDVLPDQEAPDDQEEQSRGIVRTLAVTEQQCSDPEQCIQENDSRLHWGLRNRKGLPARYVTPIRVYNRTVACGSPLHYSGSPLHYNRETYAIDISAPAGTNVYATTQSEVVKSVHPWDGYSEGYGNYVLTKSIHVVDETYKTFHAVYAHLNNFSSTSGSVLMPSDLIGTSGGSGLVAPHLHFAIWTDGNFPVDLTPLKGFTPNLDYPWRYVLICGWIKDPNSEPIVLEANEIVNQANFYSSPYKWNCSTYFPLAHSGQCYRAVVPISPEWGLGEINDGNRHQSPGLNYHIWFPSQQNYRVWICGMGGTLNDDSLHMGTNSSPKDSAENITGYHTSNWLWQSIRMDGNQPYLSLQAGYQWVNLWARENGMRVDRILLTQDFTYLPSSIRCGANGLFPASYSP